MPYLNVGDIVALSFVNKDFHSSLQQYLENQCFRVVYRVNIYIKAKHNFMWQDVFYAIMPYTSRIKIELDDYDFTICDGWYHKFKSPNNESDSKKVIVRYEQSNKDFIYRLFSGIKDVHLEVLKQRTPRLWSHIEFPPLK